MEPDLQPDTDGDFVDYARYAWGTLVRSAVFLGCSVHEAEDLAQTTLVRCYTAWPQVVRADNRAAYVYRMLLNCLRDSKRRRWWGERATEHLPERRDDGDLYDPTAAAFHGALQSPASCDDLLKHYVDRAVKLAGPTGWNGFLGDALTQRDYEKATVRGPAQLHLGALDGLGNAPLNHAAAGTRLDRALSPRAQTSRSDASPTGTNVQEAGVDEPDVVKTDGHLLVRFRESMLTVYNVSSRYVQVLGDLDLGTLQNAQLLLSS